MKKKWYVTARRSMDAASPKTFIVWAEDISKAITRAREEAAREWSTTSYRIWVDDVNQQRLMK